MKRPLLYLNLPSALRLGAVFFATLLLTSCQFSGSRESEKKQEQGQPGQEPVPGEESPADEGTNAADEEPRERVMLENTASREFDGKPGEERFEVVLTGDKMLEGKVAFTITNGQGELIYTDEFPAIMLAATYDESVNTPEKQEALVKSRIETFFEDENFKLPAIQADNPPHDSAFINRATYENLLSTDAPGFVYVIGKENAKFIAWSPLDGRMVMYFNCC